MHEAGAIDRRWPLHHRRGAEVRPVSHRPCSSRSHADQCGCASGDVLVLTKPLGTGFVTTALKRGSISADVAEPTIDSMRIAQPRRRAGGGRARREMRHRHHGFRSAWSRARTSRSGSNVTIRNRCVDASRAPRRARCVADWSHPRRCRAERRVRPRTHRLAQYGTLPRSPRNRSADIWRVCSFRCPRRLSRTIFRAFRRLW